MNNMWDERYMAEEYRFGKEPNVFFKAVLDTLDPGKILIPAAGEGRDAVYAATKGWEVHAFDLSSVGREKALKLATEKGVSINYAVLDANNFSFPPAEYDAIALIYLHMPSEFRQWFHSRLPACLKLGGLLFLEAFNPKQLPNSSGGPKDIDLLMTPEILKSDFKDLITGRCYELTTDLDEGAYHHGTAEIVRYTGRRVV
jgi:2-polyprenyl-3-methyl-5-hydroxy-6-metoxy-1,4-benzoquinol methylase